MQSWNLPEVICNPLREKLRCFMENMLSSREEELEFVVLYGSVARGEARQGSDLDLLIGLRRDGDTRFIDRIEEFTRYGPGVDIFPYYPAEVDIMFSHLHMTLLEAADHGIALFDRGRWSKLRARLRNLIAGGKVLRLQRGWKLLDPGVLGARP